MTIAASWVPEFLDTNRHHIESSVGLEIEEPLGFGWFGGVYRTNKPNLNIKITHDPSEDIIAKYIINMREDGIRLPGFVGIYESITFPQRIPIHGRDWLVNISVRDNVVPDEIAEIPDKFWDEYRQLALAYAFQTPVRQQIKQQKIIDLFTMQLQTAPKIECILDSLMAFAKQWGFYIYDIHAGNTGRRLIDRNCYLVFDLGNTPTPYVIHREFSFIKEQGIEKQVIDVSNNILNSLITGTISDDNIPSIVEITYPLLFANEVSAYPQTKSQLALLSYYLDVIKSLGHNATWDNMQEYEDGQDVLWALQSLVEENGGVLDFSLKRVSSRKLDNINNYTNTGDAIVQELSNLLRHKEILNKPKKDDANIQMPLTILAIYAWESYYQSIMNRLLHR